MKYKGIIFDLDGTLVDSIEDIGNAMNSVLQGLNYPTHSYNNYLSFIGSGLRNLVSQALPNKHNTETDIEQCFQLMLKIYSKNCTTHTKIYHGIPEILEYLMHNNINISVLSNKADHLTKKVVSTLLPNYFDPVVGLKVESLKKPNPFEAIEISKNLGLKPDEMIFIGDSDIDIQTAINANMLAVGVVWGYRPKEELILNGAQYILNHPLDLIQILEKN